MNEKKNNNVNARKLDVMNYIKNLGRGFQNVDMENRTAPRRRLELVELMEMEKN